MAEIGFSEQKQNTFDRTCTQLHVARRMCRYFQMSCSLLTVLFHFAYILHLFGMNRLRKENRSKLIKSIKSRKPIYIRDIQIDAITRRKLWLDVAIEMKTSGEFTALCIPRHPKHFY